MIIGICIGIPIGMVLVVGYFAAIWWAVGIELKAKNIKPAKWSEL